MNIPASIVSGDSATWIDDPAADLLGNPVTSVDWTLRYEIRGPSSLTLTASSYQGGGWSTSISASQSTALGSGLYYWQATATKGSDRITLGQGQITLKPNLATAGPAFDGRTQTKKDLEAVQSAMRAIISGGAVAEYTIGNRSIRKMSMTDLITLESKLKYDLALEEREARMKNGLGNPHKVLVRF